MWTDTFWLPHPVKEGHILRRVQVLCNCDNIQASQAVCTENGFVHYIRPEYFILGENQC